MTQFIQSAITNAEKEIEELKRVQASTRRKDEIVVMQKLIDQTQERVTWLEWCDKELNNEN